jgi:hypothetical protein
MSSNSIPILWEEPSDLESRDLISGIGGGFNSPTPDNDFRFVNVPGSHEKVVDDDAGRSWFVVSKKDQARAETAASRLLWAIGYNVDQNYTLAHVHIIGSGGADFEFVRFKRRSADDTFIDNWSWQSNPFVGTREFDGLRAMMAVLTNWDLKEKNNRVVQPNNAPEKNIFYVSDLDATLGKSAILSVNRSRGNATDYSDQRFIDDVSDGLVNFHFDGDGAELVKGIRVEHVRFIGELLARLSAAQLKDAFRAGCFAEAEIELYVQALSSRIHQLLA